MYVLFIVVSEASEIRGRFLYWSDTTRSAATESSSLLNCESGKIGRWSGMVEMQIMFNHTRASKRQQLFEFANEVHIWM